MVQGGILLNVDLHKGLGGLYASVILQAYCIQGVDKVRVATFFLKRLLTYVQCFFASLYFL